MSVCIMNDGSVCLECCHCGFEAEKIAMDSDDSHPATYWCEEDSENFGMMEGCWRYQKMEAIPDD